jgi:GTPase SAR1 family protein
LLVYDITNEQSFKNIEEWLKNIEKHTSQPVNKILIGLRPS